MKANFKERATTADRGGFTLVELMIAIFTASVFLAAGAASLNLLARSSAGIGNYASMNLQSRVALETFATDTRMAIDVTVATDSRIVFSVYDSGGGSVAVEYRYDADDGELVRLEGGVAQTLLTDIEEFSFGYYDLTRAPTTSALSVKEVEIDAVMRKSVIGLDNTNEVISSRFMMRNRHVSS